MIYSFRVVATPPARVLMGLQLHAIVNGLATEAEKIDLGEKDYAVFDVHGLNLKAVVQFAKREIHVMTPDEYVKAGLPTHAK